MSSATVPLIPQFSNNPLNQHLLFLLTTSPPEITLSKNHPCYCAHRARLFIHSFVTLLEREKLRFVRQNGEKRYIVGVHEMYSLLSEEYLPVVEEQCSAPSAEMFYRFFIMYFEARKCSLAEIKPT